MPNAAATRSIVTALCFTYSDSVHVRYECIIGDTDSDAVSICAKSVELVCFAAVLFASDAADTASANRSRSLLASSCISARYCPSSLSTFTPLYILSMRLKKFVKNRFNVFQRPLFSVLRFVTALIPASVLNTLIQASATISSSAPSRSNSRLSNLAASICLSISVSI